MTTKPKKHEEEKRPKKEAKDRYLACTVARDTAAPGYRIVIQCDGVPDVVLIELGDVPTVPVIHATGATNARVT
jgi:phosphoketolase